MIDPVSSASVVSQAVPTQNTAPSKSQPASSEPQDTVQLSPKARPDRLVTSITTATSLDRSTSPDGVALSRIISNMGINCAISDCRIPVRPMKPAPFPPQQ